MARNLPPGCTNDMIERAAGWRPSKKRAPPKCVCAGLSGKQRKLYGPNHENGCQYQRSDSF